MILRISNRIFRTKIHKLLWIFVFGLNGCSPDYSPVQNLSSIKVGSPEVSDKDVEVPQKLIKDIESMYLQSLKKQDKNLDTPDLKILMSIPRKFLSFKVYFSPLENKLAFNQPVEIIFSRGGGSIDLSKIVTGESGSFYLNTLIDWDELGFKKNEINEFQAYFISNSKKRKIKNEVWGAGCNSYYNVTDMFDNVLSRQGLLLNATDARYMGLIAGTFVFVIIKSKDLYLATVTFLDSRYPDLTCRS